jgi:2-iminobutanoate/2-iminopropanoate deaminase
MTGRMFFRRALLFLAAAVPVSMALQSCRPSDEEVRRLVRDEMERYSRREAVTGAGAIGPYSPAVRVGKFLFVSGQIALDPATGNLRQDNISVETTQVLDNVMRVLGSQGYDSSHVVSATVYVRDMKNYATVNTIYATRFQQGNYPARVAVEVSALPKGANIEIAVIAYKDH